MLSTGDYPSTCCCLENNHTSYRSKSSPDATLPSISKRTSGFLARKILQKIKKILKLRCPKQQRPSMMIEELSVEERQNAENERAFGDRDARRFYAEVQENSINENCENWDTDKLCSDGYKNDTETFAYQRHQYDDDHSSYRPHPHRNVNVPTRSICYVFMPGERQPVPVELRTARISGGVILVHYRPDADIREGNRVYSFTSFQQPRGQQALRPILV